MKSLQDKGLLKIKNFKKNKKKINYIYLLTPKGVTQKTKLTINFLKRRMNEYEDEIAQADIKKLQTIITGMDNVHEISIGHKNELYAINLNMNYSEQKLHL